MSLFLEQTDRQRPPYYPCIWLIEDSYSDCLLFKVLLEQLRITNTVYNFHTLDAAAGAIADGSDIMIPAIAFIDVNLGSNSGLALLETMNTLPEWQQTIKVVLSGVHNEYTEHRSVDAGAACHFVKPLRYQHLQQMVDMLLLEIADDVNGDSGQKVLVNTAGQVGNS